MKSYQLVVHLVSQVLSIPSVPSFITSSVCIVVIYLRDEFLKEENPLKPGAKIHNHTLCVFVRMLVTIARVFKVKVVAAQFIL